MPEIIIKEIDKTSAAEANISSEIVYIPGFGSKITDMGGWDDPRLYTSVSDFENEVGESVVFTNALSANFGDAGSGSACIVVAAGSTDLSYLMAKELLQNGIPVLYHVLDTAANAAGYEDALTLYQKLIAAMEKLTDIGQFDVKYVTSGGYPLFGLQDNSRKLLNYDQRMVAVASSRGDCIALLDAPNNPARVLTGAGSVFADAQTFASAAEVKDKATYAAIMYPWGKANLPVSEVDREVPASFMYLRCLAESLKTNPSWMAIAGVARGLVPGLMSLSLNNRLTNAIADKYTSDGDGAVSIIPVTNIRPTGLCFWGNRTLMPNPTGGPKATSFLNLRNLICDVKKVCYMAAKTLMFEQNSEMLWTQFKSKIMPTLDRMTTGQGLSGYKIVRLPSSDKTKLKAQIILYPVYAVEKFDITIVMTNEDLAVTDGN